MDFSKKTVVITGAGSGIGRATAGCFAKAGADLVLADINFEVPGLPLNARAIVGLTLLLRALVPVKGEKYPSFFSTNAKYIIIFLFYGVIITIAYDLVDLNFIKTYALTAVSAYCGFH